MSKKQIVQRGRHVTLPISGDTLSEICFGICTLATLVFRDSVNGESQLQLEEAVTLHQYGVDLCLTSSRPGSTFDPKRLGPLLDLLGASVVDAWARHDGLLEVTFSNGSVLRVAPTGSYEAWHFQYPRPAQPAGGKIEDHISLHGAAGRLL
jgi:hypothetical protein